MIVPLADIDKIASSNEFRLFIYLPPLSYYQSKQLSYKVNSPDHAGLLLAWSDSKQGEGKVVSSWIARGKLKSAS